MSEKLTQRLGVEGSKRGIPRGSSLSLSLGAVYLLELDRKMAKLDVQYFRYLDDILILAPSGWKLSVLPVSVHEILSAMM